MRNRLSFFIGCLVLLLVIYESCWADTLSVDDRARLGGVYSLETLKRYSDAIPVITDLYRRYPNDPEIKWTYARIMGFGGHWKQAAVVFDQLCANGCANDVLLSYAHVLESQGPNPETLPYMKRLADTHQDQMEIQSIYTNMLSWSNPRASLSQEPNDVDTLVARQQFVRALAQLDIILKDKPDDETALLAKARILSWRSRLADSVKVYRKLIEAHPDKVLYYREAARVLGWSGRIGEATSLYNEACRRFPDNQALRAEAMAKEAYYNNLYYQAEHWYERWLVLEPGNPEALFDLGQIHANSGKYGQAKKDYDQILAQFPDDLQAIIVRDKAQAYEDDWRIGGGFFHDEADSTTRQVDYRLDDAFERIEKSVLGNMIIGVTTDEMDYSFPGPLSNVRMDRYMASVEQDFLPDTFWKLGYGISESSYDDKQLQYRNAEAQFPLLTERVLLDLSYKRDDFIQNEAMLAEHLQEDQYRARATWTPIRPLAIGADEAHSEFTDGNRLDNFGADAGWTFLYDPTRLTLTYRWQDWRFAEIEPDYFSPGNFPSQRVSLEWEQTFSRNDLYWGANKFSYFLSYEFIDDEGSQLGNAGTIGIKWYVNKRLTLQIAAQHTSYDHPGIYTDNEQTISFIFAF